VRESIRPEPVGRDAELALVDAWLSSGVRVDGRDTTARTLVIEGEPGIGKTTVWGEAVRRAGASGWNVLSCRPRPSDASLSHVGLTDLISSVADAVIEALPAPQRRAVLSATLRQDSSGGPLDPRAVGAGVMALLDGIAAAAPLLLAVDDLQWLDRASARSIAFALHRLQGGRVRLLAAVRLQAVRAGSGAIGILESTLGTDGLERVRVGPLSIAALHKVLSRQLGTSFTRPVTVRIHRACGGNPFYALEIARELQRIGEPAPGRPLPVPEDQREMALLRVRRLPQATRDALAQVAAMSRPTTADVQVAALAPAEEAGVVRVQPDGSVDFTHPLFGSSLYAALAESARRRLHQALATTSANIEEHARHLALGAQGPEEAIAAALDRAAESAEARGAADIVVELKELALRLTPPADSESLVRRELELADRRYFAGDASGARRQLERCLQSLPPGEARAEVLLELGSVVWTQGESEAGLAFMQQALGQAESKTLRAKIHSRASSMAEDFDVGLEHAEAALQLIDEQEDPLLYSFALHNAARNRLFARGEADHAAVERGMELQREAAAWEVSVLPAYWALYFDEFDVARARFEHFLQVFRVHGDEARCCFLQSHLAVLDALTGHMERARAEAAVALDSAKETEQGTWILVALWATGQVAARAGELDAARAAAGEMLERMRSNPDITLENMARAVLGLAALSAGDHAEADRQLTRCEAIVEGYHAREPVADRFPADHAEAVISIGDLDRADVLVSRLEERARRLPRPWINAVAARCRGLLNAARGDLDAAITDYERALEAHQQLAMPSERGRTLLALGRLQRRRRDARGAQTSLAEAVRVFEAGGAAAWTAVARDELRRAQGRHGSVFDLTPTEMAVARLAAEGLRNREIASRMFLAEKTVEANLSRAYLKLGVRSKTELARRLEAPA